MPTEWDGSFEEWVSHFSMPRHLPDPRIHAKIPFPPPELLEDWQRACSTSICTGDLGLPIRRIHGDRAPAPRLRDGARRH